MKFITHLLHNKMKFFIFLFLILFINTIYNKNILDIKRGLDFEVVEYNKNLHIYKDRDYINVDNLDFLLNKKLIQVPRHHKSNIIIFSNKKLTIYRPICSKNKNEEYYKNWTNLKLKINIEGLSCTHKNLYLKEFDNFFINLHPGGPFAADPIFIDTSNKNSGFFKIINKKK